MEKELVGRGCFELKPIGEKQKFRVIDGIYWLSLTRLLAEGQRSLISYGEMQKSTFSPLGPAIDNSSLLMALLWDL